MRSCVVRVVNLSSLVAFSVAAALSCGALAQSPSPTPLPEVKVEAKEKAKQQKKAPTNVAPLPQAEVSAPAEPPATGKSPVRNYVATDSGTATKSDTPLRETPASMSVVGTEQMRDQGVQHLQEAVRYVPGVYADGFGFDTRSDFSVIRGSSASYYVDGLRRTYGYWANTAKIDPYSLERVEVLRGPASMIYGQTPVGGIINGISKLPQPVAHTEIGVDYGSHNFRQFRFDTTGPITTDGKWTYRLTGLARDADTQVKSVEDDRYWIAPSLTFRPNSDTTVTLMGSLRRDNTGSTQQFLPALGTLTPIPGLGRVPRDTFVGNPGDYHRVDEQSATLLFDHKFNDSLSIHQGLRYTHTAVSFDTAYPLIMTRPRIDTLNAMFGPIFDPAASPFVVPNSGLLPRVRTVEDNDTQVLNSDTFLTARFSTGALQHKVTTGFDAMRYSTQRQSANFIGNLASPFDIFNPNPTIPAGFLPFSGATSEQVQVQLGAYAQDQIKLGPWLATLGVRQDWLTMESGTADKQFEAATTWRGALMYQTNLGLNPYVSYSQSFTPQLGSVVGTTLFTPYNQRTVAGPTRGEQIEVGLKYQPKGAPFAVNAALFDLKESNLLASADSVVFADLGGASTHVKGFELELIGQLSREMKLVAAYTYMDGKWDTYPEPLGMKSGTPLEYVPKHMASLWGIYTVQDGAYSGLSFGAGVRYVAGNTDVAPILAVDYFNPAGPQTSVVGVNSVKIPSYTLFDAMVAYETKHGRWQLSAQNLTDEYYITTCGAFRGDCGIGQGRTVITSYTHRF